ncbi:MAG: redoxin domain-containing protein [Pseudobacteriovorax sp.]|nr:redoxin domain-containing protein [Pseudobacteriovorax sp.]
MKAYLLPLMLLPFAYLAIKVFQGWGSQSPRPTSSITALPDPTGARFPGLYQKGHETLLWRHQGDSLKMSHLSSESWQLAKTVDSTVGSNWAEGASIILYEGVYYSIHRDKSNHSNYVITQSSDGETWKSIDVMHPTLLKIEFPVLFLWQDSVYVLAIYRSETEQSQLITFPLGQSNGFITLDSSVCDCCRLSVAYAKNNSVVVAYRDLMDNLERPINVLVLNEGGDFVAKPFKQPEWQVEACPVNGPSLVIHKEHAFLAWYTQNEGTPAIWYAVAGEDFQFRSSGYLDQGPHITGRVAGTRLAKTGGLFVWLASDENERGRLFAKPVTTQGTTGNTFVIAGVDQGLDSGFPLALTTPRERIQILWTANKRNMLMGQSFNEAFFTQPTNSPRPKAVIDNGLPDASDKILYESIAKNPHMTETLFTYDKPVLLVFWATWCQPCLDEIPYLNEIHADYNGVQVVSILLDPGSDNLALLNRYKISYPSFLAIEGDPSDAYKINALPTTILFGSDGSQYWRLVGADIDELYRRLEPYKKPKPTP